VNSDATVPHRHVHPSAFMFLITPFGVMGGYVSVAVAYYLTKAGVSVAETAGVVALGLLPHTWKFLWSPVADTTLPRKAWYQLSNLVSALGIFAMGAIPPTRAALPLLSAVIFIANFASTIQGMAVESLMAFNASDEEKGRAGGWFQAGNLGGGGVGGGAGLWLAQHLAAPWMASAILAAACLLCSLALLAMPEPPRAIGGEGWKEKARELGHDLWSVARSRAGLLSLILCFLPLGSGAAAGLWSAVADSWKATPNTVALVTGVLGGVVSALGCLAGGWISDRMHRRTAYAAYGILQALCAIAMGLAARTETNYIVFTMLYAFITGLTYVGFTAFVLEAMGLGAAATKYSIFASLSNTPIYYMTRVDGWAFGKWGAGGMLYAEAVAGGIGLLLFGLTLLLVPKQRNATR